MRDGEAERFHPVDANPDQSASSRFEDGGTERPSRSLLDVASRQLDGQHRPVFGARIGFPPPPGGSGAPPAGRRRWRIDRGEARNAQPSWWPIAGSAYAVRIVGYEDLEDH